MLLTLQKIHPSSCHIRNLRHQQCLKYFCALVNVLLQGQDNSFLEVKSIDIPCKYLLRIGYKLVSLSYCALNRIFCLIVEYAGKPEKKLLVRS